MNDNDDFFLTQMKGVNPIKKNNKIKRENPKTKLKLTKNKTKKHNNIKVKNINTAIKKSEFFLENIDLKKGIKKGSESEERFNSTILECYKKNQRCLLFVTGKGLFKSKNYEQNDKPKLYHGIIRSTFVEWAKSKKFSKYILSFEQASIQHGGDGAFYVYLRKNKN